MQKAKRVMLLGMVLSVVGADAALAATDEEKCQSALAKAKGKYEKCIAEWQGDYAVDDTLDDEDEEKLAKCRIKYDAQWTRLQRKLLGTTCDQARFADNGDGTITDNLTGLVWEKKSDDGGVHDKDAEQTWSTGAPYNGNGTAFTTFLTTGLNTPGFAGANDWRLPTAAELQSILLPEPYPCTTVPCVAPAFNSNCTPGCSVTTCSCTQADLYWSASTYGSSPSHAWVVLFYDGSVADDLKTNSEFDHVRAVRGGL